MNQMLPDTKQRCASARSKIAGRTQGSTVRPQRILNARYKIPTHAAQKLDLKITKRTQGAHSQRGKMFGESGEASSHPTTR
jgi:hypothetical protein